MRRKDGRKDEEAFDVIVERRRMLFKEGLFPVRSRDIFRGERKTNMLACMNMNVQYEEAPHIACSSYIWECAGEKDPTTLSPPPLLCLSGFPSPL